MLNLVSEKAVSAVVAGGEVLPVREVIVGRITKPHTMGLYGFPRGTFTHFSVYELKGRSKALGNLGLLPTTPLRLVGEAPDPETGGRIVFQEIREREFMDAYKLHKDPRAKLLLCLNAFFKTGVHTAKDVPEKIRFLYETYERLRLD